MNNMSKRRQYGSWVATALLGGLALYPWAAKQWAARHVARRLDAVETLQRAHGNVGAPLAPAISLRVQKLSPLLASWETVGGCGAGGTGGAGVGVKWIGRNTTGGLFQLITQANYTHLANGYNFVLNTTITRDLGKMWSLGVAVPFVHKRYNDYHTTTTETYREAYDISNSGVGDVNLLLTRRFGRIGSTAVTATLGFPSGTHDATYRTIPLTQEKQLGLGKFTGGLMVDHSIDKSWGVIVLGALGSYRGGTNEFGNYRASMGSLYGYAGYFMGPFVPAIGLALLGFTGPDRDQGIEQNVPLALAAGNLSLEWSTDWIAILAGVSVPYGLYAKPLEVEGGTAKPATGLQPWMAAIGFSVSPF